MNESMIEFDEYGWVWWMDWQSMKEKFLPLELGKQIYRDWFFMKNCKCG